MIVPPLKLGHGRMIKCHGTMLDVITCLKDKLYKQKGLLIALDFLNHWGRVPHICVNKLTVIGSDNGLSPDQSQAIIWTNAGTVLIGPLGINFSRIVIKHYTFSIKKMHLKMTCGKWRPHCLGLSVLKSKLHGRRREMGSQCVLIERLTIYYHYCRAVWNIMLLCYIGNQLLRAICEFIDLTPWLMLNHYVRNIEPELIQWPGRIKVKFSKRNAN